jgi:chloramphenicol-sensitive protein RarD
LNYALLAYFAWGLFPVYWKLLQALPAFEILCHRIVWAIAFYSVYMWWNGIPLLSCLSVSRKIWWRMFLSSIALLMNWYIYIYAVNTGQIIESSLGYFITPLINVGLGVCVLSERLTKVRWLSLSCAVVGVTLLSVQSHHFPWVAVLLSTSFAVYGLLRKITLVDGVVGSQMEALLMVPPVAVIAFFSGTHFVGPTYPAQEWLYLIGTGVITGLPLIWFAQATQLVPLNLLGFLQYIMPSLQLVIGILVFDEPFGADKLLGYGIIWAALVVFSFDLWGTYRRIQPEPVKDLQKVA